jgi:hypothetical protein
LHRLAFFKGQRSGVRGSRDTEKQGQPNQLHATSSFQAPPVSASPSYFDYLILGVIVAGL